MTSIREKCINMVQEQIEGNATLIEIASYIKNPEQRREALDSIERIIKKQQEILKSLETP